MLINRRKENIATPSKINLFWLTKYLIKKNKINIKFLLRYKLSLLLKGYTTIHSPEIYPRPAPENIFPPTKVCNKNKRGGHQMKAMSDTPGLDPLPFLPKKKSYVKKMVF